jgi:hypothetical protein
MLKALTRSKLIQVWFATIALIVVAGAALGVSVTVGTGVMLFVLSLIPLAIVLLLMPGIRSKTAADVLYGTDRRG